MAYWMRAFCTEGAPPPLAEVFEWTAGHGRRLSLDTSTLEIDPTSADWEQAAIGYREGKLPFLAEISSGSEASEEIEEFLEELEDVPDSSEKQRVVAHLRRTSFVVATQIPTSEFDDEGFGAVGEFMRFFVEHNGGLIQADGEGFYEGDRVVLQLPVGGESPTGIGFGDKQLFTVPPEGLFELAAILRLADEESRGAAAREAIDVGAAEVLADMLEVVAEVGDVAWTEADDLPTFRWAFERWSRNRQDLPAWAVEVRKQLS